MTPPGRLSVFPLAAFLAIVSILSIAPPAARALGNGDQAPLFSIPQLDGAGRVTLESYRGKVVFLDFWASWCPPCLTSLPQLEALRREFPANRFQVVAVNLDDDPEKARKFLAKLGVGYPSGSDPSGQVPERFDLKTMPTSYLIDSKGVIRYVHEGFRKGDVNGLREKISLLLGGQSR